MFDAQGIQPVVSPAPDGQRFWAAVRAHRLELPHCDRCDVTFFYPRVLCPRCGGREITWIESAGTGTLHSFCVQYRSAIPGLGAEPFVTALVDLDEGPRMLGFLVGAPDDPELIRCDTPVAVEFLDLDDGQAVVAFRATAEQVG